jgi:hypothetical protein
LLWQPNQKNTAPATNRRSLRRLIYKTNPICSRSSSRVLGRVHRKRRVVAIDRGQQSMALRQHGADVAIDSLQEVHVEQN